MTGQDTASIPAGRGRRKMDAIKGIKAIDVWIEKSTSPFVQ